MTTFSKRAHPWLKDNDDFNLVLDPGKFLTWEEANGLLETTRKEASAAPANGNRVVVRDWFIIALALSAGL